MYRDYIKSYFLNRKDASLKTNLRTMDRFTLRL